MVPGSGPMRDTVLGAEVRHRFSENPILWQATLEVEVRQGVLTISGVVDSYEQRYAAENVARQVTGLRGIAMRVHVRAAGSQK